MLNSIDFYAGIFLHVIPVRIIVPGFVKIITNPLFFYKEKRIKVEAQ